MTSLSVNTWKKKQFEEKITKNFAYTKQLVLLFNWLQEITNENKKRTWNKTFDGFSVDLLFASRNQFCVLKEKKMDSFIDSFQNDPCLSIKVFVYQF